LDLLLVSIIGKQELMFLLIITILESLVLVLPILIGTDTYRYGISYQTDGRYFSDNNTTNQFQSGITQSKTVGDIVMLAVDMYNKRMWIGKNGTRLRRPATGSTPGFDSTRGFNYTLLCPFSMTLNGSFWINYKLRSKPNIFWKHNRRNLHRRNGRGLFKYQPPSGFLSLCSANLPTPAISDPGKYFKTVLWTGDGANGRSIVGVGFTPDLVWYKARVLLSGHGLFDSIRGALRLSSDGTGAENTNQGVISFNSDGFSLGNHASGKYIWNYNGRLVLESRSRHHINKHKWFNNLCGQCESNFWV
jgi:hypothetical protein